eukprot:Hpha_TRINITY_DN27348_c0_g1::TRINITY_DN27348_c0_g1_i1::g.658::m.658
MRPPPESPRPQFRCSRASSVRPEHTLWSAGDGVLRWPALLTGLVGAVIGCTPWLPVHALYAELGLLLPHQGLKRQLAPLCACVLQLASTVVLLATTAVPVLTTQHSSRGVHFVFVISVVCSAVLALWSDHTEAVLSVAFAVGVIVQLSQEVWVPHIINWPQLLPGVLAGLGGGGLMISAFSTLQYWDGDGVLFRPRYVFVGTACVSALAGGGYLVLSRPSPAERRPLTAECPSVDPRETRLDPRDTREGSPLPRTSISPSGRLSPYSGLSVLEDLGPDPWDPRQRQRALVDTQQGGFGEIIRAARAAKGVVGMGVLCSFTQCFVMPGTFAFVQAKAERMVWSVALYQLGFFIGCRQCLALASPALPLVALIGFAVYFLVLASGNRGQQVPTDEDSKVVGALGAWWLTVGTPAVFTGLSAGSCAQAVATAAQRVGEQSGEGVSACVRFGSQMGATLGSLVCFVMAAVGAFSFDAV